jgi:hypothetical protein
MGWTTPVQDIGNQSQAERTREVARKIGKRPHALVHDLREHVGERDHEQQGHGAGPEQLAEWQSSPLPGANRHETN